MKRPIGILILMAVLAALVYSQRHTFVKSLADEVKDQMGVDTAEPAADPLAAAQALRTALIFYESEVLDSAAVYFEQAQRLDPSDPRPFRHLGVLRARQGRPGEALRELKGALKRGSLDVWTWIQIGKLHAQLGEREAARSAWEKAMALEPGNAAARSLLEVTNTSARADLDVDPLAGAPTDSVSSAR